MTLLTGFPLFLYSQTAKIKIDVDRIIGEIDPKIYGVFWSPLSLEEEDRFRPEFLLIHFKEHYTILPLLLLMKMVLEKIILKRFGS